MSLSWTLTGASSPATECQPTQGPLRGGAEGGAEGRGRGEGQRRGKEGRGAEGEGQRGRAEGKGRGEGQRGRAEEGKRGRTADCECTYVRTMQGTIYSYVLSSYTLCRSTASLPRTVARGAHWRRHSHSTSVSLPGLVNMPLLLLIIAPLTSDGRSLLRRCWGDDCKGAEQVVHYNSHKLYTHTHPPLHACICTCMYMQQLLIQYYT